MSSDDDNGLILMEMSKLQLQLDQLNAQLSSKLQLSAPAARSRSTNSSSTPCIAPTVEDDGDDGQHYEFQWSLLIAFVLMSFYPIENAIE